MKEALTSLAQQNLHHRVFQHAPSLLTLSSSPDHEILQPFLLWAENNKLSMNWAMHMHLLAWLTQEVPWRDRINEVMIKDLLRASVTRWALSGLEHIAAMGVMVTSRQLPGVAMGLWKSQQVDKASKITLIQLADSVTPSQDSYAISHHYGSWEKVRWLALPH